MNHRKKLQCFLKKSAAVGYISLSLAFSSVFAGIAYAGPADDTSLTTPSPGPGSGPGAEVPVDNSYYNQRLSDPVVKPVDKYSYEQMEYDISALAARYGNRMTINVIGQSLDGRNIYDIIIGNPAAPKKILFQGAIHAREYIVVPLMMQQLEYMLAFYDTGTYNDQPLSSVLNNVAVHYIPMANPDGVTLSQFGESAIRSEELRQTIQNCYTLDIADARTALSYEEYLTRWKSNARGVDLNHNFDAGWDTLNPTLNHNSFTDYKGPSPLSEPESQALANLAQQNAFSAVINYHAMGRVLYWDTEGNQKAAESYDMALAASGVTGYQVLASKGVGGYKDWLQKEIRFRASRLRSAVPPVRSHFPNTSLSGIRNKQIPALFCKYIITH